MIYVLEYPCKCIYKYSVEVKMKIGNQLSVTQQTYVDNLSYGYNCRYENTIYKVVEVLFESKRLEATLFSRLGYWLNKFCCRILCNLIKKDSHIFR